MKWKNQTKFAVRAESCEKQQHKQPYRQPPEFSNTEEHFRIDFQAPSAADIDRRG